MGARVTRAGRGRARRRAWRDPFDLSHAPPVGVRRARWRPGLRVVTAPNAGPMTFTGTRSYIVGEGEVAVIDPGPDDPRHLGGAGARRWRASGWRRCWSRTRTATTAPGRAAFAARVGAPVLAHGDAAGARSPAMARLAAAGGLGGGEGIDAGFAPDRRIGEGAVVAGPGWTLTALATPGHTGRPPELRLGRGRRALHRRPRDGLGDHADLAAGRRSRGVPRQPARGCRRAGRRSTTPGTGAPVRDPRAARRAPPRAPGGARGGDPGCAGARAGDGGRAGGGDLRRRSIRRCTGRRGATCSRISSTLTSADWWRRRGGRPGGALPAALTRAGGLRPTAVFRDPFAGT